MEEIIKPLRSGNLAENNISEWDVAFINVEKEIIFELVLAANYLDLKPMLDLGCAKLATMIRGKTVEQIRQEFNIVNDFTPEEEARVREENKWCEDA
jgi:S-phase kinase-associated protein 1